MKKEWIVIVNPTAGHGIAQEMWKEIEQELRKNSFNIQFCFTEKGGKTIAITKNLIEKGFDNIIVIGGDGTMNEVANGIMLQQRVPSQEINLGIIPIGTGNDWIRTMEIPNNISKAIEIIKKGDIVYQDVGWATYHTNSQEEKRFFINTAGTGLDSIVVEKTNQQKNRAKSSAVAYMTNLLKAFYKYKPIHVDIEIDNGIKLSGDMLNFAIGIGRYNGGGMLPFPNANPTNGLFEGMFTSNMSKLKMIYSFKKLFKGNLDTVKEVQYFKAKHITVKSSESIFLETDGETLGYDPFSFGICPKALAVFSCAKFD